MSRYEDSGVEEIMRESGERFEAILREMRAIRLQAQAAPLPREPRSRRSQEERERDRAQLRELQAKLDRLRKRDPDA